MRIFFSNHQHFIFFRPVAMAVTCGDIPRLICSVIIPPIGVYFQVGCTKDLAINVLLTLLGCVLLPWSFSCHVRNPHVTVLCRYIPGIIHAVYIILKE